MPYIKSKQRLDLMTGKTRVTNPGELNYLITRELLKVLDGNSVEEIKENIIGLLFDYCENIGFKYQTVNDIMGALQCASMECCRRNMDLFEQVEDILADIPVEFYHNIVAPYEDKKIQENGDVYNSL